MEQIIDFFDRIWSNKQADLAASRVLWDSRAGEFNRNKSHESKTAWLFWENK